MKMRPFCFEDCLMPALFAYLLAVCIFLGGGYGALNWLATPEPAKVTVSAKPTPPRSAKVYDATTHSKQANKHSPGKALELMTLRTIEFPDGHRVTQLLPYRKREQALAFQPDW
jgi:hypothetical protein